MLNALLHIVQFCMIFIIIHQNSTIFKTIDDETTLSGQKIVGALQARKIAQEQAIKQTNLDIQCLRNYETACKNGTITSDDFTRIMGKASEQAQEYSKNIKNGTGSAQIYADKQKALKQFIQNTGTASKVAAVGVKALSIAGNMLAGMSISFAISKVIEGIEYLTTASERAIEKTKELQQELSQISSDYESEHNTLVGLKDEYDSLTSKIGENGAKASLSADEYERYRDITSEILGITPKLITGWDEEGRAISNKNNLLQMSIDLLDEEYQKSLRNSTTKSKNEEIAAGIIEQKKDFDNSGDTKTVSGTKYDLVWKDLRNYANKAISSKKYTKTINGIKSPLNDYDMASKISEYLYGEFDYHNLDGNDYISKLGDKITSSKENFEKFANSLSNEDNPIYQWFTDEQIDELIRGAGEYFQELARIEGEEQEYFQQYKDQLNLNARAVGDTYNDLEEGTKSNITSMIDSFDYNDMTKEKFSSMATDLKDFVNKLSTDETLLSSFNNLYNPQGENESIEDYETRVKTGIDEISKYCKENYPAIKLSFGDITDDVEDLKTKYNTAMSKFVGEANDIDLYKFFKDNSINDEYEIDYWNKVTDGAKTASEAVEMYNKVKSETFNNETDSLFSFTESQSQSIDNFQSNVKTLSDALSSLKSGSMGNGALTDFIQEFPELQGESENLEQAITNLIYNSLQELYDTLGDGLPSDVRDDLQAIADEATGVVPQLDAAFSAIQESYDIMHDFKNAMSNGMTDETLSSVGSLSQKLNDLVAGFYAGTVSADELYKALTEHYRTDLHNYGNALIAKNELSESFYHSVVLSDTEFINTFKDNYGIDLKNYKSYHEAKLNITIDTIESLGKNWSRYYDAQSMALTAEGNVLLSTLSQSSNKESHEQYAEIMSQISRYEQAKKAMDDLNNVIYNGIEANFSSISGDFAKNASSAESEFSELIDFFERRIEVLDNSLDLLKSSLENITGSFAKNSIIDGQLSINKEKVRNYTDALAMYTDEAEKILATIPSGIAEKVKNGAVSLTDFVGDGNEAVADAIGEYEKWADKVADCNQQLTNLKKTIAQLELEKFNNIAQDFDDRYDLRDSAITNIDKQISLLEEMGELVGASYYEAQKSLAEKQLETLTEKKNGLADALEQALSSGNIQAGSEEWLDMVKTLSGVEGEIIDCQTAIEKYDNAVLQLDWDTFDRQREAISNVQSELENLVDLFDDIDVADDSTGEWTADALAKLGLLAQQYEAAQVSISDYNDAIRELKQDYADGKYSAAEYAEKLAELSEGQWKAVKASESAKDAIVELNEARVDEIIEGIEKEKDAYKELVDAQIEALDAEKELHDYKKSISEKTKNVTDLEQQISAMRNDNSAAGIAKRKLLEAELAEAKEELEEAQYEHSIEAQKEALNKQYEEFETKKDGEIEALEEPLSDREELIANSFDAVKQNAAAIGERIAEVAKEHGVTVSETVTSPWQNGQGAIAGYGEALSAGTSAFAWNLGVIKNETEILRLQADSASLSYSSLFSQKSEDFVTQLSNAYTSAENLYNMAKSLGDALKTALEGGYDVSTLTNALNSVKESAEAAGKAVGNVSNSSGGSDNSGGSGDQKKTGSTTATAKKTYKILDDKGNSVDGITYTSAEDARKKLNEYKGGTGKNYAAGYYIKSYAAGTRSTKGELLIKDEEGYELGLPKLLNGSYALMPEGSQILTKAQTDNLFEWAKMNPVSMVPDLALPKLPDIAQKNINQPVTIQSNITFTGAVNDANSFARDIARIADRQVEKSWKKATDSLKY